MIAPTVALVAAACLASYLITFPVRRFASFSGLTDRPDGHRKLHGRPIPLGGGLAVFLAASLIIGAAAALPTPWRAAILADRVACLWLPLACTVIVALGLVDDYLGLRGRHKLFGQLAAAGILVAGGLQISTVDLFGWHLNLGWMGVPLTLFWLVGATNSVNLLDGIDGLATTLGLILSGTLGVMGLMTGHLEVTLIAFVFAGSLLGFLGHNFPPAKVFLGDTGSMLIGLVVGALAMHGALKGPGTVLLAAPLAIWTIPILDSSAAIVRRKLTGRSIYTADRAHLHHCLLYRLGSSIKAVACVAVCCTATSVAALVSLSLKNDTIALASIVGVAAMLLASGLFGRAEARLAGSRFKHLVLSLARPTLPRDQRARQSTVRLQGTRDWHALWDMLVVSADQLHLSRIGLDVNMPSVHEGFNGRWERPADDDTKGHWRIDLPLVVAHQRVGSLSITGAHNGQSSREYIEQLLDILEPFEAQLVGYTRPRNRATVAHS